jgi:hypothetical protein
LQNYFSDAVTISALPSDHNPVIIKYNYIPQLKENYHLDYKNANWRVFKQLIERSLPETNSETVLYPFNIDNMISELNSSINNAIENAVPKIENINHIQFKMPSHIEEIIKKRNIVKRRWQRTRAPIYKAQLNHFNFVIKTELTKIRNAKWNSMLKRFKKGSKPFWKICKVIKNKNQFIPPLVKSGERIVTQTEKANALAEHFAEKHNLTQSRNNSNDEVECFINDFELIEFSVNSENLVHENEIKDIIKSLANKKAPGNDGISNKILKQLPDNCLTFIKSILNACLKLGYFPAAWKTAKIIPILKPGKTASDPASYRPISLLIGLSKLFEKILKRRINNFIEEKNLLPDEQFGFRTGHNTYHPLTRFKKLIKNSLTEGNSVGLVTIDINAAFDRVWHNGLVFKLNSFGFPVFLTKIIQSFLTNRSFAVHLNDSKSRIHRIHAGVPQGSVLGPILYNIFTADIPVPNNCSLSAFADDMAICSVGLLGEDIIETLQNGLDRLQNFFTKWKIKVNTEKTKAIFFTRKRRACFKPQSYLKLDNNDIEWVEILKYLGITLDSKLTFRQHISRTIDKINKAIVTLYPFVNRNSHLSTENKLLLHKTIFQPILLYGAPIWHDIAKTHISKLQVAQNKI